MTEDILSLSDEAFMNMPESAFVDSEPTSDNSSDEETQDTKDTDVDTSNEDEQTDGNTDEKSDNDSDAQEQFDLDNDNDEVNSEDGDDQAEKEKALEIDKDKSLDTSDDKSTDTTEDTQDTDDVNYESAYKKITSPFKANGVEMHIDKPEDIIKLMQMGANYQKKMHDLKPNLKIIKTLQKHDLLSADKINNLIDISKKNPKALAKLFKDGGVDPLDIDTETDETYVPNEYGMSDKEYQLDTVIESIKESPMFSKTINTIAKTWDTASKDVISEDPSIISVINTHMTNGVFDKVNTVMQKDRLLGKLDGLSDVDAYKTTANNLIQSGILTGNAPAKKSAVSKDTTKSRAEASRKQKRKAAASSKSTNTKTQKESIDVLNMSDAEFEKKYGRV